jgi:hypothetical protein
VAVDYDALCADIAGLWGAGGGWCCCGGSYETNLLAERLDNCRFVLASPQFSYTDRCDAGIL